MIEGARYAGKYVKRRPRWNVNTTAKVPRAGGEMGDVRGG